MTDFNAMTLAGIEKFLMRSRRRALKSLASIDRTLSIVQNNGDQPKAQETPKTHRRAKGPNNKRVLQGKYMGAVRYLSAANKKKVKAVRLEKGFPAAIKLAKSLSA